MPTGRCPNTQNLPPVRKICRNYEKKRSFLDQNPPLMLGQPLTQHLKPPEKKSNWPFNERMVKGPGVDLYGMVARAKGTDWKWRSMLAQQRIEGDRKFEKPIPFDIKAEFLKKTDSKLFATRVERLVESQLKTYEDSLEIRRDKLRNLLIEEDKAHIELYVDRSQKADDNHFQDMKDEVRKLKEEEEAKRLKLVEEKRIQQYANRFDEYRTQNGKRNRLITREVQVYQIYEQKQLEANRKAIENQWIQLERKQLEEKRLEDEKRERERLERELNMRKVLDEQIREREEEQIKKIREEREANEKFKKMLAEDKQREIEAELEERRKHAERREELFKQLDEYRKIVEKRRNDEYQLELLFAKLSEAALKKEKAQVSDVSERNKRETLQYLENLKYLRKENKKQEKEMNRMIDEVRLDQERKLNEKWQARRERIKNDLEENTRYLLEQIKERKEQQEMELKHLKEEQEYERKQADQQILALEERQRELERSKRDYAQDLLDQMEYNKLIKTKEREEMERTLQAQALEEKKYHDKIRELLNVQIFKEMHPFRKVIHGLAIPAAPF